MCVTVRYVRIPVWLLELAGLVYDDLVTRLHSVIALTIRDLALVSKGFNVVFMALPYQILLGTSSKVEINKE